MHLPVDSDTPQIVRAPQRSWRTWILVVGVLLSIVGVLSIPAFQMWQTHKAEVIKRGQFNGSVHTINIGGQPYQLELGWSGYHMLVHIQPALPEGSIIRLSGNIGEETLTYEAQRQIYGPMQVERNPFHHFRIKVDIMNHEKILWTGILWAWGMVGHQH